MKILKSKNIQTGYLYFYIHFVTEVLCFYTITNILGDNTFLWLIPFIYDALAFVPQSIIGYISDKYPKINMGLIGLILLILGFIIFNLTSLKYTGLMFLSIGNAFIHISGAEITLSSSNGKLSHSAIFVSGGSFGVITGKLLKKFAVPSWMLIILAITLVPFFLLADTYKDKSNNCNNFNYHNESLNKGLIIILTVFIVIVRGYMGYALPTSWNKTIYESILLYVTMGIGKMLGGILSDKYGIKKVAILSMTLAVPFLLFGDNIMTISLIGVMFFSMTMSITLAILVSTLKKNPGLAFGLTTIGLFLGTAPIFFINITSRLINNIIIIVLSIICIIISSLIIRKDNVHEQH